jgi:hypothetical protein
MPMGPDDHLVETIKNVLWKDEELLDRAIHKIIEKRIHFILEQHINNGLSSRHISEVLDEYITYHIKRILSSTLELEGKE